LEEQITIDDIGNDPREQTGEARRPLRDAPLHSRGANEKLLANPNPTVDLKQKSPQAPPGQLEPRSVRAAAIDLGAVRVGLAVADDLGLLAHPRPFLDGKNQEALLRKLKELQQAEQIEVFVLGLPRELRGREGPAAKRARAFAKRLELTTPAKVELYDEWLSTREAAGRLRAQGLNARQQRGRIDSAAAAILLQSWLDGGSNGREARDP
jgi:putative Holliday junction resolvase